MSSYASVASRGPKQTPEEAAAPPIPEVVPNASVSSTASLIDVDTPSVRTVPSDFLEQDVKTTTQADRIEREEELKDAVAKAEAETKRAAEKMRAEADLAAKRAGSWVAATDKKLAKALGGLSDNEAGAVAGANLAAVVGVGAWLGYKGWNLYERSGLTWKAVGLGVGVLAVVGGVEALFGRYIYKPKLEKKKS